MTAPCPPIPVPLPLAVDVGIRTAATLHYSRSSFGAFLHSHSWQVHAPRSQSQSLLGEGARWSFQGGEQLRYLRSGDRRDGSCMPRGEARVDYKSTALH